MAGLYGKNDQEKRDVLDPIFGSHTSDHALSKYEFAVCKIKLEKIKSHL